MLAYFSTIPLCVYGRKGWMVLSMLPFDSTVKSNIAVGFILDFHYDGGCPRGSECTNSYQYIFPALFMV